MRQNNWTLGGRWSTWCATPGDFTELPAAVDTLTDALLSHLAYEEEQIVEPIARYGFFAGQV